MKKRLPSLPLAIIIASLILGGAVVALSFNLPSRDGDNAAAMPAQQNEQNVTSSTDAQDEEEASSIGDTPTMQTAESDDDIIARYKEDAEFVDGLVESLVEGVLNSPDIMCSHIIKNQYTGNHVYYYIPQYTADLATDYGQYRSRIEYIDNNLNSLTAVQGFARNECAEAGYPIE